jgi:hypothetical protein
MDQPVKITDIDMRFMSMVLFMVKWAIASIPAMLILAAIGGTAAAMILAFFGALFGMAGK